MKCFILAGLLASSLLMGSIDCQAANWVKNSFDVPNKNLEGNYLNADSIKTHDKTLSWTEKFVLTDFGKKAYTKHLSTFPACKKAIELKGDVTQHQIDFEIRSGKFRLVAKRNYNKDGVLVCTDKEMGKELDKSWKEIKYKSPIYERYYMFVSKYKVGNL